MRKILFFLFMLATLSVYSQETVSKVVDKVGTYRNYLTRLEGKGSDHYLFFSGIVINSANPSSAGIMHPSSAAKKSGLTPFVLRTNLFTTL